MLRLVTSFILLTSVSIAYAIPADQKFVKLVENIKSFEASFTQNISDDKGDSISSMKGDIKVLRPGKFYWKSNPPDAIIVVADGSFLWTYDIELEQVTKQELAKTLSSSPAAVLIGSTHQLLTDFKVSELQTGECQSNQKLCFALTPIKADEAFQDIQLIFNNNQLVEVKMNDPLGQHIHTQFTKITVNGHVKENLFKFSPPAGVDVIKPST